MSRHPKNVARRSQDVSVGRKCSVSAAHPVVAASPLAGSLIQRRRGGVGTEGKETTVIFRGDLARARRVRFPIGTWPVLRVVWPSRIGWR